MLLVPTCVLCARSRAVVCDACASGLPPAPSLARPVAVDACIALFDYRDARALITALKNGGRRDLVPWLADRLAPRLTPPRGAVVTWAPTSPGRRQARGFDQAELLARALARRWRRPCRALLQRGEGPAQAGRTARERRGNPSFRPLRPVRGTVVLVDDVATTGATLAAAARTLRQAGAGEVLAVVGARAAGRHAA